MNTADLNAAISLGKSRSDCHPDNIDTLVRLVAGSQGIPGDIVECGSYKCGATIALAAAAKFFADGSEPKKVYGLDLFGGLPYGEGVGFEAFADADFEEIKTVTSPYENIVLVRGLHEDTIPKFPKQPLSLIFMDSDFYQSHVVCLQYLWPMLSHGGTIVFHDWGFPGVQRAIDEVLHIEEWFNHGRFSDSSNMGFIVKA